MTCFISYYILLLTTTALLLLQSTEMNVRKLLKYRSGTAPELQHVEHCDSHNFKTELYNIFLVGLCFCLLMGGYNTLSQNLVSQYLDIEPVTFLCLTPGTDLLLCCGGGGRGGHYQRVHRVSVLDSLVLISDEL